MGQAHSRGIFAAAGLLALSGMVNSEGLPLAAHVANGQSIVMERAYADQLRTEVSGTGVSAADFDGDGWDDVTVALRGPGPAVFRNNGDGTFTDVSAELGLRGEGESGFAIWVDVNNDGAKDLFIGRTANGTNRLYISVGPGTYQESAALFGIDPLWAADAATFGDYDLDGYVDLFLAISQGHDILLRNLGGTGFEDVSAAMGVQGADDTIPMQAGWIDYDLDGDPDLLATHDLEWESRFYRNDGPGPWPEIGRQNGLAYVGPGSSMGIAWGDTNLDGAPDAYISRIEFGGLYMNNGNGTFSDEANSLGAETNGVSWGVVFGDFDADRDEDLAIAHTTSWLGNRPSMILQNTNAYFAPASDGFITWSRGLAAGDFNRDGKLDLVTSNTQGEHVILLNATPNHGNWVGVHLGLGPGGGTPVGVRIEVDVAGKTLMRWVDRADSYCSQSTDRVYFGLGVADGIDEMRIFWGPGQTEVLHNVEINTVLQFGSSPTGLATLAELPKRASLSVYPNPTTGPLSVVLPEDGGMGLIEGRTGVEVVDVLGRRVYTGAPGAGAGRAQTLDLGSLPKGVYFVRFRSGHQVYGQTVTVH